MYAEKSAGIFREKYISLVLAAAGVSLTCDSGDPDVITRSHVGPATVGAAGCSGRRRAWRAAGDQITAVLATGSSGLVCSS